MQPAINSKPKVPDLENLYVRFLICLGIGITLAIVASALIDYLPDLLTSLILMPGDIYCRYFGNLDTNETPHRTIVELGNRLHCYGIGLILNALLFTSFLLLVWASCKRLRKL